MEDEFPTKIAEIGTFNFDNLIKIIQLLHDQNLNLTKELNKVSDKIENISDLQIRTKKLENNNKELFETVQNLQSKLLEQDTRMGIINQKQIEIEQNNGKHEDNINKLNKVVEEHIKQTGLIEKKMTDIMLNNNNMEQTVNKIENEFENFKNDTGMNLEKDLENLKSQCTEIDEKMQKKFSEIDKTFSNIMKGIQYNIDMNKEILPEKKKFDVDKEKLNKKDYGDDEESLIKYATIDIENLKTKFESFLKDYEQTKEKEQKDYLEHKNKLEELEKELNDLSSDYEEVKKIVNNNKNNFGENLSGIDNENKGSEFGDDEFHNKINIDYITNIFINSEPYKKLNENIRIITTSVGDKISKSELEQLIKKTNIRIDKLEDKIGDVRNDKSNILKKPSGNIFNTSKDSHNQLDMDFLSQNLESQITDQIKALSGDILRNEAKNLDLSQNPFIIDMLNNINSHGDEINKNYKSIIDIRNLLLSSDVDKEVDKIKLKMSKLEEDNRMMKSKLYEIMKNLDVEEEDKQETNNNDNEPKPPEHASGTTFKEKINVLSSTCSKLNEKINNCEKKLNGLTKGMKEDIRQNLKNETGKVIEDFKRKLDSFTSKFEHELKNKIDQMGLSSFEHKINNKFYGDLREKLDKHELRKNNNVINRKIDSLENKISKTLVDTIIDLQMDDAPLLVKKGSKHVDKCASCGQSIQVNNNTYVSNGEINMNMMNRTISKFRPSTKFNIKDKEKEKKLPDINEKNSNK
jgi:predicted  nucleic acid-binding Zn-ribbon protein